MTYEVPDLPSKLYHGTSTRYLDAILKNGIKPRGRGKGNWEAAPSISGNVYLTSTYAPYFAAAAVKSKNDMALILEIDTNKINGKWMADEDAILARFSARSASLSDRNKWAVTQAETMANNGEFTAEDSLNFLGTCAVRGIIRPEAITAYVTMKSINAIMSCDASIVPINYMLLGEKYKEQQADMFNPQSEFFNRMVLPEGKLVVLDKELVT
jgi:hypothetical protein